MSIISDFLFSYATAKNPCSYTQNSFAFWGTSSTDPLPELRYGPQWGLPSARPTYITLPLTQNHEYAPAFNWWVRGSLEIAKTPSLFSVLCSDFRISCLCSFLLKENSENLYTKWPGKLTFRHCNLEIVYVLVLPTQRKNDSPRSVKKPFGT